MSRGRKQPAPVIPDGDDLDPDPDDYAPKAVRADVEAAKDFLLFARAQGITFDEVTIGGVKIQNVIDHFPRKAILERMAAATRRGPGRADDLDEFATPEERRILASRGVDDED